MAQRSRRRRENVDGAFFVDDSCIDCDTCRWMAPSVYDEAAGQSRVHHQPADDDEGFAAALAQVACPTNSIGGADAALLRRARAAFPLPIDGPVFHCGFHAANSYGAASYLVVRPQGNVLVDAPRFDRDLVARLEELGGVSMMVLTHEDDVGDHAKYAARFDCPRVLHESEARGALAAIERPMRGDAAQDLAEDLRYIPTPGHTRGSACLLVAGRYLFTGDHLAWSARLGQLYAFRSACWYDWDVQIASMEALRAQRFAWVLPGHGRRAHLEEAAMRVQLDRCIAWMRAHPP